MEDQAELIRQQMQEKRAELSEKLQELAEKLPVAEKVTETVETVSETVTSTAEDVQESVQETVHTFEDILDLPKQVQEHPWLAVGGAVVVGYLAHDILATRQGGGASILAEPLRELEDVAMRAAVDMVGHTVQDAIKGPLMDAVKGPLLGAYGPILGDIFGQLMSGLKELSAHKSGQSSHNGHGAGQRPAPAAPPRRPAGTVY